MWWSPYTPILVALCTYSFYIDSLIMLIHCWCKHLNMFLGYTDWSNRLHNPNLMQYLNTTWRQQKLGLLSERRKHLCNWKFLSFEVVLQTLSFPWPVVCFYTFSMRVLSVSSIALIFTILYSLYCSLLTPLCTCKQWQTWNKYIPIHACRWLKAEIMLAFGTKKCWCYYSHGSY